MLWQSPGTPAGNTNHQHRYPRPLRDATRVLGRRMLSSKELRQLSQGTLFFMQALIAFVWSLVTGAVYLSEHPAIPVLEEAGSMWKTPWVQLLCQHPAVVLHTVAQWRWGCSAAKPTGLLALGLPKLMASMYARQDPAAQKPTGVAIGVADDGRFRTSTLKEYPPCFCDALAATIIDELYSRSRTASCRECAASDALPLSWLREASVQCSRVSRSDWLPDYQGD